MLKLRSVFPQAYRQRYFRASVGIRFAAASILFVVNGAWEQYADWKHSGSIYILITYLDELSWSQDRLLVGRNGIAALTFCNVPISECRKLK